MEIRSGSKTILEPNATVRMSDGDHLSIMYTTASGETSLITVNAHAFGLVLKEHQSRDELVVQPRSRVNVFREGGL